MSSRFLRFFSAAHSSVQRFEILVLQSNCDPARYFGQKGKRTGTCAMTRHARRVMISRIRAYLISKTKRVTVAFVSLCVGWCARWHTCPIARHACQMTRSGATVTRTHGCRMVYFTTIQTQFALVINTLGIMQMRL